MKDVISTPQGFLAVGAEGEETSDDMGSTLTKYRAAVWVSADGVTWERIPSSGIESSGGSNEMEAVTEGGPGYVAVGHEWTDSGRDAAVWVSEDGQTWRRAPDAPNLGGPLDEGMRDVVALGGNLIAVGGNLHRSPGMIWVSSDGLVWNRVIEDGEELVSLDTKGGRVLAIGDDGYWSSANGFSWTGFSWDRTVFVEGAQPEAIALTGDRVVIGGSVGSDNAAIWIGTR